MIAAATGRCKIAFSAGAAGASRAWKPNAFFPLRLTEDGIIFFFIFDDYCAARVRKCYCGFLRRHRPLRRFVIEVEKFYSLSENKMSIVSPS